MFASWPGHRAFIARALPAGRAMAAVCAAQATASSGGRRWLSAEAPPRYADHMVETFVGSGVYDAVEVSHLLAEPAERVLRWAAPDRHGRPAIVPLSLGRAFSFLDLVSLAVASELWRRRVSEPDLRHGVAYLQRLTGQGQPLAHRDTIERLATAGAAWLANLDGEWYDIGKGGQGPFEEVVRLYLERIAFDELNVARLWRPAPMVVLDPRIQAGKPCLEGTRVPTETIAAMVETDSHQAVADELDLTVEQVEAAVDFEDGLRAGRGIAA